MIVTSHKTHKIHAKERIETILDTYLPPLKENTVVAIASKIISICQNNIISLAEVSDKKELIKQHADWYYIDEKLIKYGIVIPTITNNILVANAGIDESNVAEGYLLWPKNIQETTQTIWKYLRNKHQITNLGVLITDSRLTPLSFGITGVGIAWCGFEALQNYIGKADIFGRELKMSQKSVLNGLASSAVVVTGEGDEQTPLATITDVPFVKFQTRIPTPEELQAVIIPKEDDIYGKMLTSIQWKKGGKRKKNLL